MMLNDEFVILKACSFKIDDETMCIATLQYHIEKDKDGKTVRTKSRYRWLARVCKISDVQAKVAWLCDDSRRLDKWRWPNDPSWDGCVATNDSTNDRASAWLNCRLKKLVDWELGQKLLKGWKKCEQDFNLNAAYDTEDYICEDGSKISLTDREALKKQLNKNMHKELYRNVKAKEREAKIEELRKKVGAGSDVVTKAQYEAMKKNQAQPAAAPAASPAPAAPSPSAATASVEKV